MGVMRLSYSECKSMPRDISEKEMMETSGLLKYRRISIYSTFFIIMLGVLSSLFFEKWELLSRTGSLIVIVGVYIAFKDFSGGIYNSLIEDKLTYEDIFKIINITDSSDIKNLIDLEKDKERSYAEIRKFTKYASLQFKKMEMSLILGGTFLWGYGDLIMNLLWSFNA